MDYIIVFVVGPNKTHLMNRKAFCMRMRQYGLLKCHRGIFCELFTFSTSICRLFSGAELRVLVACVAGGIV